MVYKLFLSRALKTRGFRQETPVCREDLALLFGILLAGGVLYPILLLIGLQRLSAVVGSLLLNLEAPFTVLLTVGLFKEHVGWREACAILLILLGAGVLNFQAEEVRTDWLGVTAIAAACLSWAIDNNLTQRLSLRTRFSSFSETCLERRSGMSTEWCGPRDGNDCQWSSRKKKSECLSLIFTARNGS